MTKDPLTPTTENIGLDPVEILVCATCRLNDVPADKDDRPGKHLLQGLMAADVPDHITIRSVECLSNCKRGCTIVLRANGKWTYVYGHLDPETDVETVIEGAKKYSNAADGLVPWRERPEHFRKNCIARIPPLKEHS